MIRLLRGMPTGVLGIEAVDDVEKEDYENVIIPAVEAALAEHDRLRLVYVLGPEFDDYEGEAVWEDLKLGARHPVSFERVAIVTDARWAGPAVKLFSALVPGQARASVTIATRSNDTGWRARSPRSSQTASPS